MNTLTRLIQNISAVILSFLFTLLISSNSIAQQNETFQFFPEGIIYDTNFPTPASILGYEVGDWHVSHDQLVYYMKEIARLSDRITIEETGRTYEHRPLLLLTITSPENHSRINEIKAAHVALSDPNTSASIDISNMPAVVWLGHSVHGMSHRAVTPVCLLFIIGRRHKALILIKYLPILSSWSTPVLTLTVCTDFRVG